MDFRATQKMKNICKGLFNDHPRTYIIRFNKVSSFLEKIFFQGLKTLLWCAAIWISDQNKKGQTFGRRLTRNIPGKFAINVLTPFTSYCIHCRQFLKFVLVFQLSAIYMLHRKPIHYHPTYIHVEGFTTQLIFYYLKFFM